MFNYVNFLLCCIHPQVTFSRKLQFKIKMTHFQIRKQGYLHNLAHTKVYQSKSDTQPKIKYYWMDNSYLKNLIFLNFKQKHLSGVVRDKEVTNVGRSLFFHENGRSSNFFYRSNWIPEFDILPQIPENV